MKLLAALLITNITASQTSAAMAEQPQIKGCTAPMNCTLAMPMQAMKPVSDSKIPHGFMQEQMAQRIMPQPMACTDSSSCHTGPVFPKNQSI